MPSLALAQPTLAAGTGSRQLSPNNINIEGVLRGAAENAGYTPGADTSSFAKIVAAWIRFFIVLVGLIFITILVYGGWLWLTSAGEEDAITKAKKVISAGFIGMVLMLMSWAISNFIVNRFTEAALSNPSGPGVIGPPI
ncbi:hypothetical protein CL634_04450 [bacterium]|nr:hypothetical protein [bacterium]